MDYASIIEQMEARKRELEESITAAETEVVERRNLLGQIEAEATQLRRERDHLGSSLRELHRLAELVAPEPSSKEVEPANAPPSDVIEDLKRILEEQQAEMERQRRGGLNTPFGWPPFGWPNIQRPIAIPDPFPQHPWSPYIIGDPVPPYGPTCGGYTRLTQTRQSSDATNSSVPWLSDQK